MHLLITLYKLNVPYMAIVYQNVGSVPCKQYHQIIGSVSVKNTLHMLQQSTQTQPTPTHTSTQTHMHAHTLKDTKNKQEKRYVQHCKQAFMCTCAN